MYGVREGFQAATNTATSENVVSENFNINSTKTAAFITVDKKKFNKIDDNKKLINLEIFVNRKCYSAVALNNFKKGGNSTADMINLSIEPSFHLKYDIGSSGQDATTGLGNGTLIRKPTLAANRAARDPRWGPNGTVTAKMLKDHGLQIFRITNTMANIGSANIGCNEPNGVEVKLTFEK
jgi:hypothetical protein